MLFRSVTDPDEPEWIAPGNESEPRPRDGYVVSFVVFHERGLGSPVDQFMRALPHYYGVELHNFSPNSIAQAAIFVAICEGYLGIAPHWELWLHLFRATFTTKPGERRGLRRCRGPAAALFRCAKTGSPSTSWPSCHRPTVVGMTAGSTSATTAEDFPLIPGGL